MAPEVLAACFFFLGFGDVICVSHVCRAWRSTALAFPKLWSSIRLGDGGLFGTAAKVRLVRFLYIVLSRARQHPVDLSVNSCVSPSVITPILHQHSHHLKSLSWTAPDPVALTFLAPILESFACNRVVPFPADLFGSSPGRLRSLKITGMLFLPVSCPALRNVTSVTASAKFHRRQQAESLSRLFLLMPRLESLKLYGFSQSTCASLPSGPAPRSLESVTLSAEQHVCDVVTPVSTWRRAPHRFHYLNLTITVNACDTIDMGIIFEDAVKLSIDMKELAVTFTLTTTHGLQRDFTLAAANSVDPSAPRAVAELLQRHIAHLRKLRTLRAPASILNKELLVSMPALTGLCTVLPKWETTDVHVIRGRERNISRSHLSCGSLSFLQYTPFHCCPALARLEVHIDVEYSTRHPTFATRHDADEIVSTIGKYVHPMVDKQAPLGIAITGFPGEFVGRIPVPSVAGYSIYFRSGM